MKIHHVMKLLVVIGIIFSLLNPAFADNIGVSVTNSTMNFGNVYTGVTTSISSTITVTGNTNVDFYVRANGNLTDSSGDIILDDPNFQIRIKSALNDSGYVVLSGIDRKIISSWPKPNPGGGDIATETYRLTVPPTTPPGIYITTVTLTVVTAGTSLNSVSPIQMNGVTMYSINNTVNTSSDDTVNLSTIGNASNITYTLLTLLEHYS